MSASSFRLPIPSSCGTIFPLLKVRDSQFGSRSSYTTENKPRISSGEKPFLISVAE